jgi:hypothetical protein
MFCRLLSDEVAERDALELPSALTPSPHGAWNGWVLAASLPPATAPSSYPTERQEVLPAGIENATVTALDLNWTGGLPAPALVEPASVSALPSVEAPKPGLELATATDRIPDPAAVESQKPAFEYTAFELQLVEKQSQSAGPLSSNSARAQASSAVAAVPFQRQPNAIGMVDHNQTSPPYAPATPAPPRGLTEEPGPTVAPIEWSGARQHESQAIVSEWKAPGAPLERQDPDLSTASTPVDPVNSDSVEFESDLTSVTGPSIGPSQARGIGNRSPDTSREGDSPRDADRPPQLREAEAGASAKLSSDAADPRIGLARNSSESAPPETAPASPATSRPPEADRQALAEGVVREQNTERPLQPVRELRVQVPDQGGRPVEIKFESRGGQIRVTARAQDPLTALPLQREIDELRAGLESKGFSVEGVASESGLVELAGRPASGAESHPQGQDRSNHESPAGGQSAPGGNHFASGEGAKRNPRTPFQQWVDQLEDGLDGPSAASDRR